MKPVSRGIRSGPGLNLDVWQACYNATRESIETYLDVSGKTRWSFLAEFRDSAVDLCLAEVYHGEKEVGTKR